MTRDYFKAASFAVVCIVALFWTAFAGVVAYHTAMDKSPLTIDGPTCIVRIIK